MSEDFQRRFDRLSKQAVQLYRQGQYEQAITVAEQARDLARQYTEDGRLAYAVSLHRLGFLHFEKGDYAAAEPFYLEALAIVRSNFGEAHPQIAFFLNDLATLYQAMGAYAQAEPLFQQALDIRRNSSGEASLDFAISLNNLGELYRNMYAYRKAEPLFQEAQRIGRTVLGEDHPAVVTVQSNLAALYIAQGKYALAEPLAQRVLENTQAILGEEHPDFVASLHNLALLYYGMGDYMRAESLYKQALDIQRKKLGEMHPDVATTKDHLGLLYKLMGNYAQARTLLEQALETRRTTLKEAHPDVATSIDNLGKLYHEMNDYAQAEPLYKEALQIRRTALGETHSDVAISLHNLATLYHYMHRYAEAKPLYQEALDIQRKALGETHLKVASILDHQAALCRDMGDYPQAVSLFQQALQIKRAFLKEDHTDVAISLNHLATLYSFIGDYAQAELLYQEALQIRQKALGKDHPDVATSLIVLATLYAATARQKEAFGLMERAATIGDEMIGQVFSLGSERQRMAYLASLPWGFYIYLSLVIKDLALSPEVVQKGLNLVLRRKGIGAEALAIQRDVILGGRYPHLVSKLEELTKIRRQIIEEKLARPEPEGEEIHQQHLDKWNENKERLETELAKQIPEMKLSKRLQSADWQTVAQALPQETILVEFIRYTPFDFHAILVRKESLWNPARYAAFALSAGEPGDVQLIDLGEAEKIDEMIAQFRTSIINEAEGPSERHLKSVPMPSNQPTTTNNGIALRRRIFDPLLKVLGSCERLFLAPDGDLTRLPFEVLPTDDGQRLIDKYQMSYLSTGRDALRFDKMSTVPSTAPLVVADPDFDLHGGGSASETRDDVMRRRSPDLGRGAFHFGRLEGTRVEGLQIAAQLGVSPLLDQAAVEESLKSCRSPRILHLATHGFFLPDQQPPEVETSGGGGRLSQRLENPLLRSGLALAGANTWLRGGTTPPEAEDGLLTAEDVSGLDLLATELVVLSACETGLGEVHIGEGVFGLRRAFVLAGAKTLVMSLWKVPDQQTQELMREFYRRMLSGQPCTEALRQAQLAMKAKYPHPRFWGAFICQGDPRPILLVRDVAQL